MRGGVPVHESDHGSGQECAEDALETEPLGQCHERDQQRYCCADPDLRGAVLQPDEHPAKLPRSPGGSYHQAGDRDEQCETGQQHQPPAGAAA